LRPIHRPNARADITRRLMRVRNCTTMQFGNCDNVAAADGPGKRDRGSRAAVRGCDLPQHAVAYHQIRAGQGTVESVAVRGFLECGGERSVRHDRRRIDIGTP
jgi:hypothetical protein